jgi:hypothetical protein
MRKQKTCTAKCSNKITKLEAYSVNNVVQDLKNTSNRMVRSLSCKTTTLIITGILVMAVGRYEDRSENNFR